MISITSSGTPLQGTLTTEIRPFDTNKGPSTLPEVFLTNEKGIRRLLLGAVYLKMTDSNGNIAAGFSNDSLAESIHSSLVNNSLNKDFPNRSVGGIGTGTGAGITLGTGTTVGIAGGMTVLYGVAATSVSGDDSYPTTTTEDDSTTYYYSRR